MNLSEEITRLASLRRRRVGIALSTYSRAILRGLERSREFADVVVVGADIRGFDCRPTQDPAALIVDLLFSGEIDGAVRGNVPHAAVFENFRKAFNLDNIRRCSLIRDAADREFFFGPTGLAEGVGREDKLEYVKQVFGFMESMGVKPVVGVLSGRSADEKGVSSLADEQYEDSEWLVPRILSLGYQAKHFENKLELAIPNSNFVVAASGMTGNAASRAMWLIGGRGRLLGLSVLTGKAIFEDTSKSEQDFSARIIFATARANGRLAAVQ